jgi:2,3-bisphosphoglycerate-independent phosphoglycerate mutase
LLGTCLNTFKNLQQYIQTQYDEKIYDEFLTPAINGNYSSEQIGISNNDAIIFFNFRPDRARQLSHILIGSEIYDYQPKTRKTNLYFVTMMNYEGIKPSAIAYPPHLISNVLGEILEKNNLRQLRIAETEKYAHVTFFFDGGLEQNFNGEIKTIINSPKVLTYDLAPEMSAYQITDELISQMESNDVIICNFANGDMVGHTGNLEATIKAVEIVDECIGKIYDAAQKNDYVLFITADHGNADVMLDDNDEVITSHSINNVPFLITDNHVSFTTNRGILGNIAPSILAYLGIAKPNDMLPSIIKINK